MGRGDQDRRLSVQVDGGLAAAAVRRQRTGQFARFLPICVFSAIAHAESNQTTGRNDGTSMLKNEISRSALKSVRSFGASVFHSPLVARLLCDTAPREALLLAPAHPKCLWSRRVTKS